MAPSDDEAGAASKRRFWDNLLIPLIVGLILAFATYLIPRVLEAGRRLSYTTEKPTGYLSEHLQGVTIQVNGTVTTDLFVTKVRLWNSGSVALKDLGVLFVFNTADQNFKILSVAHATKPEREFGQITQTNPDDRSTRFVYSLLNRNDEDTVSFLTNQSAEPTIYAKAEDLKLVQVAPGRGDRLLRFSSALAGAIAVLASLLSSLFSAVARKRQLVRLRDLQSRTAELKARMAEIRSVPDSSGRQ